MPAWGSVTLLEALWVLVAAVGVLYSGANLDSALGDQRYIRAHRLNGGRRLVARGNVRRESVRLSSLVSCLAIGLYSAVPTEWTAALRGWLPQVLLIWVVSSLTVNSFLDRHERVALMTLLRIYEQTQKQHEARTALRNVSDAARDVRDAARDARDAARDVRDAAREAQP